MGMKRIENVKVENPFDGVPFQVAWSTACVCEHDAEEHRRGQGCAHDGCRCKAFKERDARDMTVADAIRLFLLNAFPARPPENLKEFAVPEVKDCDHILKVLDVIRPFRLAELTLGKDQPKHFDLYDDDHQWLVEKLEQRARFLWGPSTSAYVRPIKKAQDLEVPKKAAEPANGGGEEPKGRLAKVK